MLQTSNSSAQSFLLLDQGPRILTPSVFWHFGAAGKFREGAMCTPLSFCKPELAWKQKDPYMFMNFQFVRLVRWPHWVSTRVSVPCGLWPPLPNDAASWITSPFIETWMDWWPSAKRESRSLTLGWSLRHPWYIGKANGRRTCHGWVPEISTTLFGHVWSWIES